jgi:hypothetical protein
MVSTIILVASAVAGVIALLVVTQGEQIQAMLEESTKPSATKCEFVGQRLSEDYYCTTVGSGRDSYFEVKKISEGQPAPRPAVKIMSMAIDETGYGVVVMSNGGASSDTVKSIAVNGKGQANPNFVIKPNQSNVSVPFNLNTNFVPGSQIVTVITMQSGTTITQSLTISPAGQIQPLVQEQQGEQGVVTSSSSDAKDVQFHQRIFARELFNGDVELPYRTGVHTGNAKSLEIMVEGNSSVIATIEGTNCVIQGMSFDKICDVPADTDIFLRVDGAGQTHLVLKMHYIF